MSKYIDINTIKNTVILGDNIEVLKTLPDNSIDAVVTDPPYGLGKEPDATEVLQSWLTQGYHEVSGKGFMGREWDAFVPQPNFWKEVYRVLKPGGHVLSFAGTRTYDWTVMAVRLAGFEIRDMVSWVYGQGFPKNHDISKAIDKHFNKERKVIGKKTTHKPVEHEIWGNDRAGGRGMGFKTGDIDITAPNHDLAKKYEGWGTALKPAVEPIVLARKPFKGTVAENVIKYGTGGINIGECRVPAKQGEYDIRHYTKEDCFINDKPKESQFQIKPQPGGRHPANLIHDSSEEVLKHFPTTKSSGGSFKAQDYKEGDGATNFRRGDFHGYGDEGSAARFFYTAKASPKERNAGLDNLEDKPTKSLEGGAFKETGSFQSLKKNTHPTVKPIELMRYLIKLITPVDGIVLDPFVGAGSTAIAAVLEHRDFIAIEMEPEYVEIAELRIKHWGKTLDE